MAASGTGHTFFAYVVSNDNRPNGAKCAQYWSVDQLDRLEEAQNLAIDKLIFKM